MTYVRGGWKAAWLLTRIDARNPDVHSDWAGRRLSTALGHLNTATAIFKAAILVEQELRRPILPNTLSG
jgi:hypothetical protein